MENVPTQDVLISVFKNLMDRDDITADHDLVASGLNSLQAVGAAMLARGHGLNIQPLEIIKSRNIKELAKLVVDKRNTSTTTPDTKNKVQTLPSHSFTPTQLSWQQGGFKQHYNVYSAWQFKRDEVDLDILDKAIRQLCAEQEELNLRIFLQDGQLIQQIIYDEHGQNGLEIIDLSTLDEEQRVERAGELATSMQYQFKFERDQALHRFVVFRMNNQGDGWIFFLFHHYMVDGFGFGVLLNKLTSIYNAICDGNISAHSQMGSGAARLSAEKLQHYAETSATNELDYWKSFPWVQFNQDMISEFTSTSDDPNRFNEHDAKLLLDYQSGAQFSNDNLRKIFESQATVIEYLDPETSTQFLGHNWGQHQFSDFDVFALAAGHALRRFAVSDALWFDMLGAARTGIFEDLDVSSTVGYISELTPFIVDLQDEMDLIAGARRLNQHRSQIPRQGIGLRAMKFLNKTPSVQEQLANVRLPQMGINYRASLQYSVRSSLLNLTSINPWLGPTMDERGIAYRFWFRISYSVNRLEILLRYNPKQYSVDTAMRIVADTKEALHRSLRQLNP